MGVKLLNDPVLRKPCAPLTKENDIDFYVDSLLKDMNDTMEKENGIGLAANQIGHSVRIFILKTPDGYQEYINPEIVSQDELVDFDNEGCLSIPGTFAKTKRYKKLRLKWVNKLGIKMEDDFTDMQAFAVQHEMDHLDGKLYIDQLGQIKKELVINKHKKFMRLTGR